MLTLAMQQEGRLPDTVRFTPSRNTSGLFIAKIRKALASQEDDNSSSSSISSSEALAA